MLFGGAVPIGVHGMATTSRAAIMGSGGLRPGALTLSLAGGCTACLSVAQERGVETPAIIAARIAGETSYAKLAANAAANDAYAWAHGLFDLGEGFERADSLAVAADPDAELYIVPPRLPLEAPWGLSEVRGAVMGFDVGTSKADLVRAAMETAAFAARDVIESIDSDGVADAARPVAKASGGIAESDWTMQFLADVLNRQVERLSVTQAAALGVAWLAGLGTGEWPNASQPH